ncbi:MAG: TROVE domain-containing protein, partial [Polyangiales bacterium]
MDYLKNVGTRQTPPTEHVPGRTDQVKNSAGGVVFEVDAWAKLDRFLLMGSEGGTYYVGQRELTLQNVSCAIGLIASDGVRVVERVVEISDAGRAPSNDPALFVLALASAGPSTEVRQAALDALPKVARIGTHLFHFMTFVRQFRGRGRSLNRALRSWYEDRDVDSLALQAVKFKQRDGWSHRDVMRLCKPKTDDPVRNAVFAYMVGKAGVEELATAPRIIEASVRAQAGTLSPGEIRELRLPREALRTEDLNNPAVWEELLYDMPIGALVRNLGRLTASGFIKPFTVQESVVVQKLLDERAIKKSRIHPIAILLALRTYASGGGALGKLTWHPCGAIVEALNDAFKMAFENVAPTGKRTLIGLDVSGSMGSPVNGAKILTCREASAAMASILIATEEHTHTVGFVSSDASRNRWGGGAPALQVLPFTRRSSIEDIVNHVQGLRFGGTDISLPMLYALDQGIGVDA